VSIPSPLAYEPKSDPRDLRSSLRMRFVLQLDSNFGLHRAMQASEVCRRPSDLHKLLPRKSKLAASPLPFRSVAHRSAEVAFARPRLGRECGEPTLSWSGPRELRRLCRNLQELVKRSASRVAVPIRRYLRQGRDKQNSGSRGWGVFEFGNREPSSPLGS